MGEKKAFVTTSEVAEYMGYSTAYIRKLCNERQIPFYRFGRSIRFKESEVREWAENGRVGTVDTSV